jgi:enamine deaminase RidA (YjgF/YER057c/UK114 family)
LSSKGLLSQQVRDGLRALLAQAGDGTIVKLRAFVAGSGDTRRVAAILSETFTARRRPLPALTVAQVGGLAAPGVQVVMEAAVATRRTVNPNGLGFFAVQRAERGGLEERLAPLAREVLPKIRGVLGRAGLDGGDVVRATCFLSSVEDVWEVRSVVAGEFPKAAASFVQPERSPVNSSVACEVTARLRAPARAPLRLLKGETGQAAEGVLIGARRLVLTGGQMAFGFQEADARLAFQRLARSLEQFKASLSRVAYLSTFALSRSIGEMAVATAAGYLGGEGPPAGATVTCVALPALDASFAVEAVGVVEEP